MVMGIGEFTIKTIRKFFKKWTKFFIAESLNEIIQVTHLKPKKSLI